MLFPLPARDPKQPIDSRHLRAMAQSALLLTQVIRDYLPVKEGEHDNDVLEDASTLRPTSPICTAAQAYQRFERLRNPNKLAWPGPVGSYMMDARETALLHYKMLCEAMQPLVEHYEWQELSEHDVFLMPHLREGETLAIRPIDPKILSNVETPTMRLSELTRDVRAWGAPEEDEADEIEAASHVATAIRTALGAWEDAYAMLAARMNQTLATRAPGTRIEVDSRARWDYARFEQARQIIRNVLLILRGFFPERFGRDETIQPWSLGQVNDTNSHPHLVGLFTAGGLHDHDNIEGVFEFLESKSRDYWTPDHWERCIVESVQEYADQWREWFGDVIAAAEQQLRDLDPPDGDEDVPLSERAQLVLKTMLELDATNSDRRIRTALIGARISVDDVQLKRVMDKLRKLKLVDAKVGSGGGFWLTARGKKRANKLSPNNGESA